MLPTDKEIYADDEVPEYQTVTINGVSTQVPWKDVREEHRWLKENEFRAVNDPRPPKLKFRVPIVARTIVAQDANGMPCAPERAARYYGEMVGANPKHTFIGESFGGNH